jgi:single-strand DNA-binding protein
MASVNKVILIGNLTRDPELRYSQKGTAICDIGLAVNRKYKLDSGESREEVTFLNVTFWGKQAETISKWMKKGQPIYVEGRLQTDSWDDKTTGQKRYKTYTIAEEFQFLGGGGGSGGSDRAPRGAEDQHDNHDEERSAPARPAPAPEQRPASHAPAKHNDEDGPIQMDDDDIPF